MLKDKKILVTGGAGTLGRELIKTLTTEPYNCHITIFSRDAMKHHAIRRDFPMVHSVIGDVRDYVTVYNAMVGKDIVIHAAAVKHIPEGEWNSIDTWEINVDGSMNVLNAATHLGTPEVIGISTDKACHPANAYGATKYLMEKAFQEYARIHPNRFMLVRYGNVLESTGSVIQVWKEAVENGEPVRMTNPKMTRFWISPKQAVKIVTDCLTMDIPSGYILIPRMKTLSIAKIAEYCLEGDWRMERIPLRPGEKLHETLLTIEEAERAFYHGDYFVLRPTTMPIEEDHEIQFDYTSATAQELTKDELLELLSNE